MKRTLRIIEGVVCACYDVGCADLERAGDNRQMVANKENISFYLAVEAALRAIPEHSLLPTWIPQNLDLYNGPSEEN